MRYNLRHLVRSYRQAITIFVVIFFGLIFFITVSGFYPIMVVNGDWISARRFRLHLGAAEHYESQARTTSATLTVLKNQDLTLSIVSGLIEEQLIEQGAEKEFGKTLDSLRTERTNNFLARPSDITEESRRYGLSRQKFEKEILRPQVTRDLLAGRLFLQSLRLEDWLVQEKKKASITIFSQVFSWNEGEVRAR